METYRKLVREVPTMPSPLDGGEPNTHGVLGGRSFIERLPHRIRIRFLAPVKSVSVDSITAHVARLHRVSSEEIRSSRREARLVLARAQIAWYATEHAGATLSEVSKHLRRNASTLSRMIGRHRRRHPKLFTLQIFKALRIDSQHGACNCAGGEIGRDMQFCNETERVRP
jgi:hypothetical protein